MSEAKPDRIEVSITLDHEAASALDTARRRDRLSRPAFMRTVLVRALGASGDLVTDIKPEAGR